VAAWLALNLTSDQLFAGICRSREFVNRLYDTSAHRWPLYWPLESENFRRACKTQCQCFLGP
jgi:hypothetical protein